MILRCRGSELHSSTNLPLFQCLLLSSLGDSMHLHSGEQGVCVCVCMRIVFIFLPETKYIGLELNHAHNRRHLLLTWQKVCRVHVYACKSSCYFVPNTQ